MADDTHDSNKEDMKLLAELVALFGVKKGTDWYFVYTVIKLIAIIGFLVYCICG